MAYGLDASHFESIRRLYREEMETTSGAMWLACVIVALPLLWVVFWRWNELLHVFPHRRKGFKLPPGSMGIPLFGEMLTFLWYFKFIRRPDDFINSKRRKYGDGVGLYKSYLLGSPCALACFPAINKFVFQKSDDFMLEWPNLKIVGASSLVAVHGESHIRIRSYISNAINRPEALRGIALRAQPHVVAALRSWAEKGKITAFLETKKVTFENVGRLFASFEPGPKLDSMEKCFGEVIKGVRASHINIPGTAYYSSLQCRKKLEAIFRKEMENRKRQNADKNDNSSATYDLMDGLMNIKDEQGKKMGDHEVIDNIISLIVAGYESTALASMWAIYYLAKSPHVLEKLREENMPLSKSKNGEYITSEEVSKLKYTSMVVEETIRMANIAPFVFRTATRDIEYKGYTIPKGWKVLCWVRYLHTDPANFDDPMCFNPDRWSKSAAPGTYQVFGGGSRICTGNMLARIQLAILFHHLSVGYKWELLNPDADIQYLSHPKPTDGVEVVFSKL